MIFLPIVERELRVASRWWSTYWLRAGAAFGAIAVGTITYLENLQSAPHEIAATMFAVLSGLALVYSLFAGVRWTADSFSDEKREGTLGLLFLTDLKGYDVVFGKLVATSMGAFYGLLSIFPVLAIPLLMGGVTQGEFWRMAMLLADTFLFSLAIGLVISTLCVSSRKAKVATFIVIVVAVAVLPLIAQMVWFRHWPKLADRMNWACPFFTFSLSFDQEYARQWQKFWWSAGTIHGLSWLCLIAACVIAPSCWQDRAAGALASRRQAFWRKLSFGDAQDRVAFRGRLLDMNAFYWLAGRDRLRPLLVWGFFGVIACAWAWGRWEVGVDWFGSGTYFTTAVVVNSVLKLWLASSAGRQLGDDRRSGALELLLSTTVSVRDILRGQWLALRRQFLAPVLFALVMEFFFMVDSIRKDGYQSDPGYLAIWLAFMLMLMVDLTALGWVGMWVALTSRNPNRATGHTVWRLLILPWLINLFVLLLSSLGMGNSSNSGGTYFLGLWVVTGLVFDLFFAGRAFDQLRRRFRLVATESITPERSLLRRWFGSSQTPAPQAVPEAAGGPNKT